MEAEVHSLLDPEQVKIDLAVDITNLNDAMLKQHVLLFQYGAIAVRCRSQSDRLKQRLELIEAALDTRHRRELKEENPKVTETQVAVAVKKDPQWLSASRAHLDALAQFRMAEAVERAFEHRKDMLLQVARNMARESEGPMRVVANQDAKERLMSAMRSNGQTAA